MYTLAKELNIPPHELGNYPASLVSDLMLIFAEVKPLNPIQWIRLPIMQRKVWVAQTELTLGD